MSLGAATLTTLPSKTTHPPPAAPKAHGFPPKPHNLDMQVEFARDMVRWCHQAPQRPKLEL